LSQSCGHITDARSEVQRIVSEAQRFAAEAWRETNPDAKASSCESMTARMYRIHGYVNGYNVRSGEGSEGRIDISLTESPSRTFIAEMAMCMEPAIDIAGVGETSLTSGQMLLDLLEKTRTQLEAEFDAAAAGCSK
jgi:hypothetical protein